MTGNQQFIIALIAVLIGPLVTYFQSRKNEKAIKEVHGLVNSKIGELLEVTRSDAKQQGATEEREKADTDRIG
jgi:hypothetical protein